MWIIGDRVVPRVGVVLKTKWSTIAFDIKGKGRVFKVSSRK